MHVHTVQYVCVKVHVCVHTCLSVCVCVAPGHLCVGFCMHRMVGVGGAVQDFG